MKRLGMETSAFIEIGDNTLKASKHELRFLKAILDKLELPYILDDISFHNTLFDLNRMKTIHNTNAWKVEKDGSISLNEQSLWTWRALLLSLSPNASIN
jgi:hypothetical protein